MSSVTITRYSQDSDMTLGVCHVEDEQGYSFMGYTLEPPWLDNRRNISCIPKGKYDLGWRTVGSYAEKYKKKGYPGALEIMNVPDRSAVLCHSGNWPKDSLGCVLLGATSVPNDKMVGNSRIATERLYARVAASEGAWRVEIKEIPA